MDKFHKLLELVDKNANTIPEGDYIEMCNIIKEIHEKVRPPPFLLDQNEPMTMTHQEQVNNRPIILTNLYRRFAGCIRS